MPPYDVLHLVPICLSDADRGLRSYVVTNSRLQAQVDESNTKYGQLEELLQAKQKDAAEISAR